MDINKIEVCRSYSRKIKGKVQYEMIDVFCSLKQEVEETKLETTANKLQELAEQFVEKDIARLEEVRDKKPKEHQGTAKIWGKMRCPNCKNPRANCQCDEDPSVVSQEVIEDLNKQDRQEKNAV